MKTPYVVGVAFFAGLLGGSVIMQLNRPSSHENIQEMVKARQFKLVDKNGRAIGV
jgi:hypothetical protein